MTNKEPEILAPVGNLLMAQAAVHNGADAIYVGMPGFNARGRTVTLSLEDLREIIDFCHLYGVKVFIAFNVLIFERELDEVVELLSSVIPLGPDAFIVQDLGLARLIHILAPDQVVHASTQMTVTNVGPIEITSDLNINRYVLGREVSIDEMRKIRALTSKELEVFVHGALCVSYSGQCLTSESLGGRSANRGQCAQSCRLPYQLIVNGEVKDLGEKKYLVSPKDLCALDDVQSLIDLGIDSFKIEGRLKSPEYVASSVKSYKDRVRGSSESALEQEAELSTIYSRGFFNGWMKGVNHQQLVDGRYGNHHGKEVGRILDVEENSITISSTIPLTNGVGVVFADFERRTEYGATIYEVASLTRGEYRLKFSRDFDVGRLSSEMCVFVNSTPKIEEKWRKSFKDKHQFERISVDYSVSGKEGERLNVAITDGTFELTANSNSLLTVARSAPVTPTLLKEELDALSDSPFVLRKLESDLRGELFIHQKELKEIRRSLVRGLIEKRTSPATPRLSPISEAKRWLSAEQTKKQYGTDISLGLNVLIREIGQLEGLRGSSINAIYLDFEFGKEYAPAITLVREMGFKAGIATTRILKTGENGHLDYIKRLKPDVILVRNLGALQFLSKLNIPLVGDFSLNASNSLTFNWLLDKGLAQLCPSYDLNKAQLRDLLDNVDCSKVEITVHQYMPAFHMEHCVFAAFLSNGSSWRDCGKPCEKYRVELKDQNGSIRPLKADAECRNTMFNGVPQAAARLVPELLSLGVKNFRVEALYESASELRQKVEGYSALLNSTCTADELLQRLKLVERYGLSEGQLYNIKRYQDRKKSSLAPTRHAGNSLK